MRYIVRFSAEFDASHQIKDHPRCGRGDGHRYKVTVETEATYDATRRELRWVAELREQLDALVGELRNRPLDNMMPGVITTPEGIATWFMERLLLFYPALQSVTVSESPDQSTTVVRET